MSEEEIENVAEDACRSARLDPRDPSDEVTLARLLVSSLRSVPASALPGDAAVAKIHGSWRLYVAEDLPPLRRRWAVLHELAEVLLWNEDHPDIEALADRLAAALALPRPGACSLCKNVGPDYSSIAAAACIALPSAALRFGEATGCPIMVLGKRIRIRGRRFDWPSAARLAVDFDVPLPEHLVREWAGDNLVLRAIA